MTIDSENITYINADKLHICDNFVVYNPANLACGGHIRAISFKELCKAVAKQLVKDGVIPGGDE